MQPKQLDQAHREVSKLVDWLISRDYYDAIELQAILERADAKIQIIVDEAIRGVVNKLEESYIIEADLAAQNKLRKMDGQLLNLSKSEQSRSATEAKRMRAVTSKLREL